MKILVTGCCGYIGSHTCVELLNNGYEVIGLDNFSNSKKDVLDRIFMLINDEPNLREVQAFPASASGADNMMGSPSVLDDEQLEELGIEIVKED